MKYHLGTALLLTLLTLLSFPQPASAADVVWQIHWQEDGTLQEEVQVPGLEIKLTDPSWNRSQEGEVYILRREVNDWSSYQTLADRLPLQVVQSNYLVFQKTLINIAPVSPGGLFSQLAGQPGFQLNLSVPGFLSASSPHKFAERQASWYFADSQALLQAGSLASVITVDGLLLGMLIFGLGILVGGILIIMRSKQSEKIIAEEFALYPAASDLTEQDGPQ